MSTGTLYLVATPIGNLEDLTYRAVRILGECDFIAAEDTRVSAKLLRHLEISKPMVSYYEHNRKQRGAEIVRRILDGECCALMTDAGTPAVSDPGEDLVALCAENGIPVVPVPGACAAVCALAQSGLPSAYWCFEGFLPVQKKARMCRLDILKRETRTMIVYEAPHKLRGTLDDLLEALGDRRIAMAREITKLHEECLRMTLREAVTYYKQTEPRGEYVLVIEGAPENSTEDSESERMKRAVERAHELEKGGMTSRDAVRQAAKDCGVRKNVLYQAILAEGQ
ncbi:MAG: 16S rRNA (cytidine(1402)-2'-O)-methyltransferase [Butyricicoccaceae bacterium]